MHKNWIVTASDTYENAVGTGLHPLVSRILTARGHTTDESVRAFLSPMLVDMIDPGLLLGIPAAVSRLMAARAAGEKVCIYGDYDVDGISGTALLVSFLRKTGFSCDYFIPNRFDDGTAHRKFRTRRVMIDDYEIRTAFATEGSFFNSGNPAVY